jgi:hypothetical protein
MFVIIIFASISQSFPILGTTFAAVSEIQSSHPLRQAGYQAGSTSCRPLHNEQDRGGTAQFAEQE